VDECVSPWYLDSIEITFEFGPEPYPSLSRRDPAAAKGVGPVHLDAGRAFPKY